MGKHVDETRAVDQPSYVHDPIDVTEVLYSPRVYAKLYPRTSVLALERYDPEAAYSDAEEFVKNVLDVKL